jgi:hypothetical protein
MAVLLGRCNFPFLQVIGAEKSAHLLVTSSFRRRGFSRSCTMFPGRPFRLCDDI